MSRAIRFLLDDELQQVCGVDPHTTVLDWLRLQQRLTGTKEGCAEGDCGACTVAIGELDGDTVRYRSFNACIQLLASIDGKQLVTVEHLANGRGADTELHPVQQAMVDQHGAQCGFCTPGFVMSLFTLYHQSNRVDSEPLARSDIDRAIAGNLCRCTGYAPIVRAAKQAANQPPDDRFIQQKDQVVDQLRRLEKDAALVFEHCPSDEKATARRYFAPRRLTDLWQLQADWPDACLVAGTTDVGLWITKELRQFDTLIYLGEVEELKAIESGPLPAHLASTGEAAECLQIGAAVTYTDAMPALLDWYPELRPMLLRLGADQVRNAGTVGGNIANGSPIGDMPPALIALDASLVISSTSGRRIMPLENFFLEYGKQDLQSGECVELVLVPAPVPAQRVGVYKVSKRFDQDISGLCGGFTVQLVDGRARNVRICFGGMAGTPARALKTEAILEGNRWDEAVIERACGAMADDYKPLTDWRASQSYRLLAAQNLLRRFWHENQPESAASRQVMVNR